MAENTNAIVGFQFKPRRCFAKATSDSDSSWESVNESDEDVESPRRKNQPVGTWCKCGNCEDMPSEEECFCCRELETAAVFELGDDACKCIIEHAHFVSIVILKDALWTALVGMHDREACHLPNRNNVPPRYASYRQFTWWVHNRIGRRIRRVIPSCVVNRIRREYPAPDGIYVGYKDVEGGPDAINEVNLIWAFRDYILD